MNIETLGQRVKAERLAHNLTQAEVCEKIELSQPSLSAIEAGDVTQLKGITLLKLSACLGVSPQWMETGEGSKEPAITGSLIPDEVVLVDAYRRANSKTRKAVLDLLQTLVN